MEGPCLPSFSCGHHSPLPIEERMTYIHDESGKGNWGWETVVSRLLFSRENSQVLMKITTGGLEDGDGDDKLSPHQIPMYCWMVFCDCFLSLSIYTSFKTPPYCTTYQSFIPSYAQILCHCKNARHFFIHSSADRYLDWWLHTMLLWTLVYSFCVDRCFQFFEAYS